MLKKFIMKKQAEIIAATLMLLSVSSGSAQILTGEQLDTARVYTELEEALIDPSKVYRLHLTRARFKEFPHDIFRMTNLNELKLDRNRIASIPKEIAELKYLQHLSISRNALEDLDTNLCNLTNLTYLNVSDNFITHISDDVQDLQNLETLILWMNPVEEIPTEIGMLEKLRELDLLHIDLNAEEQDLLRNILPNCNIHFSPPCNCTD